MISNETFETMLTGGHPNSLGRTLEVVELVLANPAKLDELFSCYFSQDEVVRLRTSNALKRVSRERPEWLVPYIDRLLAEVSEIDQPSAQWTLAQVFQTLAPWMSEQQLDSAQQVLKRNLSTMNDWIVLNLTMQTLAEWAAADPALKGWLLPHLDRLSGDSRKSVAKTAKRLAAGLQRYSQ